MTKFIIFLFLMFGCASNSLNKLKEQGYTDSELKKMRPYFESYSQLMSSSLGGSLGHDGGARVQTSSGRMLSIYCACVKKIGPKCDGRLDEVAKGSKKTWLKGNAAKIINNSYSTNSSLFLMGQKTAGISEDLCP